MADCNIDKTVEQAEKKIPFAYILSLRELTALYEAGQEDIMKAVIKAYIFGFCRGTRAKAKNRVPVL